MSSTLSDSQRASNAAGQPFIPFNIDKDPIRWEGNPAHLEGALFEVAECFNRTGKFMTLLEEGRMRPARGASRRRKMQGWCDARAHGLAPSVARARQSTA